VSSYGEADLIHVSHLIGRVRLKYVTALPALGPRLGFTLGIQLHDQAAEPPASNELVDFRLTDLNGDARLNEHGPFVGSLLWSGKRGQVRSSNYGHESDVELTCELDWHRLEALERRRQGKQLELWLALWPRLEMDTRLIDVAIRSFPVRIPAEAWVAVLEQLRGDKIEILEVSIPAAALQQFRGSLAELTEARRQVDQGEYATAIVRCRKAADILAQLVRLEAKEAGGVGEVLEPFVGQDRAKAYAQILTCVKRLGNVELHAVVEHGYSRSEALFAIRTMESLLELYGSILNRSKVN
jgi:hypothetical protein